MFGLVSVNAPNIYRYRPDREETRIDPYPAQSMRMQARRDSIRGPNIMNPKGMRGKMIVGEKNVPSIVASDKPTSNNLVSPQTTLPGPVINTGAPSPGAPSLGAPTPGAPTPGAPLQPEQTFENEWSDVVVKKTNEESAMGGPSNGEFQPTPDGGTVEKLPLTIETDRKLSVEELDDEMLKVYQNTLDNWSADDSVYFNALKH